MNQAHAKAPSSFARKVLTAFCVGASPVEVVGGPSKSRAEVLGASKVSSMASLINSNLYSTLALFRVAVAVTFMLALVSLKGSLGSRGSSSVNWPTKGTVMGAAEQNQKAFKPKLSLYDEHEIAVYMCRNLLFLYVWKLNARQDR